jgi:site-specific DNA recombinase
MIAAIYARKSTEQNGVADEQKSVTRQVDHARAYAERKGWTVAEECVFVDDGISGAEFANRPGFLRLMNALKPLPTFQVLIMSEESRLGREAIETAYALKQLVTGGVRVFFYLEDRERTLETPTDKFMMSLTAFTDELEREKARQRTYDAMARKARAGHVTGGRVFGYDNVDVLSGSGDRAVRSHVERRVNESEAAVVLQIFQRCAGGSGVPTIAKQLNQERAASPRAQQGSPRGWAPSSVREVLYRPLYRGEIVWNQSRKRNAWGQKNQKARPESEWCRVPAPHLRIVSDELWQSAHARLAAARATYVRGTGGEMFGRPPTGLDSKHLLTGLARCGECGGSLLVRSRSHGKQRALFYACSTYHRKGRSVCPNNLETPLPLADEAVLSDFERDFLRPDTIEAAIAQALRFYAPNTGPDTTMLALQAELARVEAELSRLAGAVAGGGDVPALLAALKDREERRIELRRQIAARPPARGLNEAGLQVFGDRFRAQLEEASFLLRRQVSDGRQILRTVLDGRLVFTPHREPFKTFYEFTGSGSLGRMISGVILKDRSTGCGVPNGIRTRVLALKGPRPGPLDDGDMREC